MAKWKPTPYADMFDRVRPSERFKILSLDPFVARGRLAMAYRYFAGPVAGRFFRELRDHRRIMGIRCRTCGTVYVPPPSVCGQCFEIPTEWVEVAPRGILESYTCANYSLPVHPVSTPVIYGLVRLDGADTNLIHLLGEVDPHALRSGLEVEAVFKEERQGNILDIRYFRPLS